MKNFQWKWFHPIDGECVVVLLVAAVASLLENIKRFLNYRSIEIYCTTTENEKKNSPMNFYTSALNDWFATSFLSSSIIVNSGNILFTRYLQWTEIENARTKN